MKLKHELNAMKYAKKNYMQVVFVLKINNHYWNVFALKIYKKKFN